MTLQDYEYYRTEKGVLYCGDCLEILPLITEKVDLVLTDPPYNASNSKIKFKNYKSVNEEWDKNFKADFVNLLNTKQLIVFCSYHSLNLYLNKTPQQILHWIKNNFVPSISGKTYHYCIEYILWFVNERPYTYNKNQQFRRDYIFNNLCSGKDRTEHPTQKPITLINILLGIHSNKNDLILDPFLGSGTTAVSCEKNGRRWIGIEIDEKYCRIAKERIEKEANQCKMF